MTAPRPSPVIKFALLPVAALLLAGWPVASDPADPPPAERQCPQPRATQRAPDTYQALANPLAPSAAHLARGRDLYEAERPGGSCAGCHGVGGDGRGLVAAGLVPPPRDFTCEPTMAALSDGQLYWVTRYGSGAFHLPSRQGAQQVPRPGRRESPTAMTGYAETLSEAETWLLVLYLRTFATAPGND